MEFKVSLSNEQLDELILNDLNIQLTATDPKQEPELFNAINLVMNLYKSPEQSIAEANQVIDDMFGYNDPVQQNFMYGDLRNTVEPTVNRVSYHFGV